MLDPMRTATARKRGMQDRSWQLRRESVLPPCTSSARFGAASPTQLCGIFHDELSSRTVLADHANCRKSNLKIYISDDLEAYGGTVIDGPRLWVRPLSPTARYGQELREKDDPRPANTLMTKRRQP
jgi:hypothetical protein